MSDTARCANEQCPRGARREPIEWYPGPGMFCPDCGEPLTRDDPRGLPAVAEQLRGRTPVAIAAGIAVLLAVAFGTWGMHAADLGVRVCTTSMSDRLANEIVREYGASHRTWPYRYTLTEPGNAACDVRFRAVVSRVDAPMVARDGVVAVVNPGNPISRLTLAQLSDVLAGRIVDWSQLGAPRGPIAVVVPPDNSDEMQALASAVMHGRPFATHVLRQAPSEIVRSVVSPSGSRAIGIVPFSAAIPAKVLALADGPAPSSLSIGNGRYPLAVRVVAGSDFRKPAAPAADLISFAASPETRDLVLRTAMVSKNGL